PDHPITRFSAVSGLPARRNRFLPSCKIEPFTDGGYSSVAERQTVALDVVGSTPTTHPKTSFILNALVFSGSDLGQVSAFFPLPFRLATNVWAGPRRGLKGI